MSECWTGIQLHLERLHLRSQLLMARQGDKLMTGRFWAAGGYRSTSGPSQILVWVRYDQVSRTVFITTISAGKPQLSLLLCCKSQELLFSKETRTKLRVIPQSGSLDSVGQTPLIFIPVSKHYSQWAIHTTLVWAWILLESTNFLPYRLGTACV